MLALQSVEENNKISSSLPELCTKPGINVRTARKRHSRRMKLQGGYLATVQEETPESSSEKEICKLPRLPRIQEQGLVCQHRMLAVGFTENYGTPLPKEIKVRILSSQR